MNQKGFSLIELIIVVAILGFIVYAIANLPGTFKLIGESNHESLAKTISTQVIEDARSTGYTNLANGQINISDSRLASLPSYSGTRTISDCPVSICKNGEQMKEIDVSISWNEGSITKTFNISSFIAKGGLQ